MALSKEETQRLRERALAFHKSLRGKIAVVGKAPLQTRDDLSLAYTPGVAEPCKEIAENPDLAYDYTAKSNLVAVVTDGTAVLGLGDIGPAAAMPVMEGKAVLFKRFAGVDAVPLCLNTKDVDRIVEIVRALEPTFGGVNLEDISAPRCFEIENRLKRETQIPVFHDDQHGTAIVTVAALHNALVVADKAWDRVRIVINGAGAAGIAIAKLLLAVGARDVILCDRAGAIYAGRPADMNPYKLEIAKVTNPAVVKGSLSQVLRGADVFIGVSAPGVVTVDDVRAMQRDSIIMAMANPIPEIFPDEALAGGAKVVATGRSDFANQINNVLVFPGIFRGALDVRSREITTTMEVAAAQAIAALIPAAELRPDYIIPSPWNPEVAPAVAAAAAEAAMAEGVARLTVAPEAVRQRTRDLVAQESNLDRSR